MRTTHPASANDVANAEVCFLQWRFAFSFSFRGVSFRVFRCFCFCFSSLLPSQTSPRAAVLYPLARAPTHDTRACATAAAHGWYGEDFAARRPGALPPRVGALVRRGQVTVARGWTRRAQACGFLSQPRGDDAHRGASPPPPPNLTCITCICLFSPLQLSLSSSRCSPARLLFACVYVCATFLIPRASRIQRRETMMQAFFNLKKKKQTHTIKQLFLDGSSYRQAALERYLSFSRGDSGLTLDQ